MQLELRLAFSNPTLVSHSHNFRTPCALANVLSDKRDKITQITRGREGEGRRSLQVETEAELS